MENNGNQTPQEFEVENIGDFNSYHELMEAYAKMKCEEQAKSMYTAEEVKEVLIRFKSDVISNNNANIKSVNPFNWFSQFIKDEENQGRFIGFTKEQMIMFAGYCQGIRMLDPTKDVSDIFNDFKDTFNIKSL